MSSRASVTLTNCQKRCTVSSLARSVLIRSAPHLEMSSPNKFSSPRCTLSRPRKLSLCTCGDLFPVFVILSFVYASVDIFIQIETGTPNQIHSRWPNAAMLKIVTEIKNIKSILLILMSRHK